MLIGFVVLLLSALALAGLVLFLNWYNEPLRAIERENRAIAREDAAIRWKNARILRGL